MIPLPIIYGNLRWGGESPESPQSQALFAIQLHFQHVPGELRSVFRLGGIGPEWLISTWGPKQPMGLSENVVYP